MACKSWNRFVRAQPLLFNSLLVPACIISLHSLQDKCLQAPLLTPDLLQEKRVLFKTHRKILFDWLVDVQGEYQLSSETLHTAFALIDRCMQLKPNLPSDRIQLLGATCMFIASKFCCDGTTHPSLPDMIWVCDNAFTRQEHSKMEIDILTWTQFVVRAQTPSSFIEGLCQVLNLATESKNMACYLTDLFLLDAESIGLRPSCIAAASILVALHTLDQLVGPSGACSFEKTLNKISYLACVPAPEIRSVACKMQQLHFTDYLINGRGNHLAWHLRPEMSEAVLRAVYERHSIAVPSGTPAALKEPNRTALVPATGTGKLCCCWCRDHKCAEGLQFKFCGALFSHVM